MDAGQTWPEDDGSPGLPTALACVAEGWVRLPAGAVERLIEVAARL